MKLISSWHEIKNAHPRSKNFYERSPALLIAGESFEQAKEVYTCLFTVLLNEGEGFEDEENLVPTSCRTAKHFLRIAFAEVINLLQKMNSYKFLVNVIPWMKAVQMIKILRMIYMTKSRKYTHDARKKANPTISIVVAAQKMLNLSLIHI